MFATLVTPQPSYGPNGEPFSVRARFAAGVNVSHHWTEAEAMDARDAAFDAGARSVHVAGLPARLACTAPAVGELPEVLDD